MSNDTLRATLDTTVILGAVGSPHGPNAAVIAQGLVGIYTMVLAQSVIAEAIRHLRRGFGKVPPLSDDQIEGIFVTLFQHLWTPDILLPAPPTTLDTRAVHDRYLAPWLVTHGYVTPDASRRLNPLTRVGDVSAKDLHVLAVAVQSASSCIVTSNLADYPSDCGVDIVPPSRYLISLMDH